MARSTLIILKTAIRLSGEGLGLIKTCWKSIALYELVFYVLSGSITAPLIAWVTALLIRASGRTVVSNFEIVSFLTSTVGLITGAITVTLFLAFRYLQEAVVLKRLALPMPGHKHDWLVALRATRQWIAPLLRLGLLQCALFAMAALPFIIGVVVIKMTWLTEFDINYYLAVRPPEFRRAAIVLWIMAAGALGIGAILWTLLIYAVPLIVFANLRALAALRRSIAIAWEHFGISLVTVLSFGFEVLTVSTILWIVTGVLEKTVMRLCTDSMFQVVFGVAMVMTIEVMLAAFLTFFAFAFWGGSVAALSRHVGIADETSQSRTASGAAAAPSLLSRGVVLAGLLVLALGTAATSWAITRNLDAVDRIAITAHRGASLRAPENTLSAVDAAIEDGADMIEIDVQETRDGAIIVMHDSDFMRVASDPRHIWDLDIATARSIDVGAWFSPEFKGERVPTLAEVIERVRGHAKLLIELKYNGHDVDLARRVLEIVEQEHFGAECMIMTLDYAGLRAVRELQPDVPIGLTVGASLGSLAKVDVDFLSLSGSALTPKVYEMSRARDIGLHVWTVNDDAEMYRYLALGVDYMITDDVARAVALRDEYDDMSVPERILLGFRYHFAR